MKTLYLMRHAKSDWSGPETRDQDRALAPRGKKAAKRMARHMMEQGLIPDRVLCSTAVRARLTLALILKTLDKDIPVSYSNALYFTSPDAILDEIRETDDDADRVLVVGHNPDTQAMAVHLAGDAHQPEVEAMARKFPTAALAVYNFDVPSWRDIGWGGGRVHAFVRPKALPEDA